MGLKRQIQQVIKNDKKSTETAGASLTLPVKSEEGENKLRLKANMLQTTCVTITHITHVGNMCKKNIFNKLTLK